MIEVAELPKLFQDLIAPDSKAVVVEQIAAEALAKARYDTVLTKLEVLETKLNAVDIKHDAKFDQILKALDIDRRLERVEAFEATLCMAA
jgi:hypothetical protein